MLGWDEAFLPSRPTTRRRWPGEIQDRVRAATGLDCTVGIGRNRLQAKLATGFGKPAGVFRITGATWFEVLGDRPTDALWGIGGKTARKLAEMGIVTVRQWPRPTRRRSPRDSARRTGHGCSAWHRGATARRSPARPIGREAAAAR